MFLERTATGITTLALAFALFSPRAARAAKFLNQFVEFELPAQWQCNLEGAEWVCQSMNEQKKRDAIIVLAAKLKGDQDSLDQYLAYLKRDKTYNSVQGKPIHSHPRYANSVMINGHPWVDSLHLESEIPGFYTRYLATVKQDIGVLVTYSINKDKYAQYEPEFENLVRTLTVFRKPGGINTSTQGNLFRYAAPNVDTATVFPGTMPDGGSDRVPAAQPKKDDGFPVELIGLIALVAGYIIWKRKRDQQV